MFWWLVLLARPPGNFAVGGNARVPLVSFLLPPHSAKPFNHQPQPNHPPPGNPQQHEQHDPGKQGQAPAVVVAGQSRRPRVCEAARGVGTN